MCFFRVCTCGASNESHVTYIRLYVVLVARYTTPCLLSTVRTVGRIVSKIELTPSIEIFRTSFQSDIYGIFQKTVVEHNRTLRLLPLARLPSTGS